MMSIDEEESFPGYTYDELAALTKAELLVIAEEKGIEDLSMNNLKDEIIYAILGALN